MYFAGDSDCFVDSGSLFRTVSYFFTAKDSCIKSLHVCIGEVAAIVTVEV